MNALVPSPIKPFHSRRKNLRSKAALLELARGTSISESLAKQKPYLVGVNELLNDWIALEKEKSPYGPTLKSLVERQDITDILINGSEEIWIDGQNGLQKLDFAFGNKQQVLDLAVRLAATCGKRLDDAKPIVDGILPDGIRLHAVIPPIAPQGTLISLRCPSKIPLGLPTLIKNGTICSQLLPILELIIKNRKNFFISGATGSGKTTILAALLSQVCKNERIVAIEEIAELKPLHPHFIALQERQENVQRAGGVTLSELIKAAMRMRPDRIVLGECRGAEVREVLAAMNTGHNGSAGTVHANSISHIPSRLISLGSLAHLSMDSINAQIIAGVDCFIHVSRSYKTNKRWISEVGIPLLRNNSLDTKIIISVTEDGNYSQLADFTFLMEKLGLGTLPQNDTTADLKQVRLKGGL